MTTRWTPSSTICLPRHHTARNLDRPTLGTGDGKIAAALGRPFMPWQQRAADVAGELLPDGSLAYQTVLMFTPRQSGKTLLLLAKNVHRAIIWPDYRAWYTAQTGIAARDVWYEWERILRSTMPNRWDFRRSAGQETATYPPRGSFIRAFPPTPESLHSKQSDSADLDEVWSLDLERGNALTQAVVPTQATRPHRQLWIVTTVGTDASIWARQWYDKGVASLDDPTTRTCMIDYGMVDGDAYDDPDVWARTHPAYGHTINADGMRAALEQTGGELEFRRAYGNQWPPSTTSWRTAWPACASTDRIPPTAPVSIAADAAPGLASASIATASTLPDGRIAVEVVDARPGVDWLKHRLITVASRQRTPVHIVKTGPLAFMIAELRAARVHVVEVSATDYSAAVSRVMALTTAQQLAHPDDPRLNLAVDNATMRDIGERRIFARRDLAVDISPLVSASVAVWAESEPKRRPSVYTRNRA